MGMGKRTTQGKDVTNRLDLLLDSFQKHWLPANVRT